MTNQLLLAACIGECHQAMTHLRATGTADSPEGKRLYRLLRTEFYGLVAQWPGDPDRAVEEARAYATARQQELSELLNDKRVIHDEGR